jgi:prepilin-type N-terminal cleavage/methylation domain-containing protein
MKKARPGYTLIELMIVVVLIGVVTALAAPQLSQAWANNAVSDASNETIIAFRTAITQAKRQGRAIGVFIDRGGATQIVRVDRSLDNLCSNLPTDCTVVGPGYGGLNCGLHAMTLTDSYYVNRGVKIRTLGIDNGAGEAARASIRICVPPRGQISEMVGAIPTPIVGNVVVRLHRVDSGGASIGVTRTLVIGQNGTPRTLL